MKKVLVVEDEKLIRQGITAMIKRSGVPVEEVIECNNGIAAMDILAKEQIDVMFTDIRMPKMNGIELVQAMQELDNPPLAVAISGYDDFSYAVEMMRHGVREYILKPVERDKLKTILEKLDAEINHRIEDKEKLDALDNQLLKYMLRDKASTDDNTMLLAQTLTREVGEAYVVVVTEPVSNAHIHAGITLKAIMGCNVYILPADSLKQLQGIRYIGVSDVYSVVTDLKKAYEQAFNRRIEAFLQNMSVVDCDLPAVPEELIKTATKLTEENAISARVQMMGADKPKELKKEWDGFFIAAVRGQIPANDFLKTIDTFALKLEAVHKLKLSEELAHPLVTDCLDNYREGFMEFIFSKQQELCQILEVDQTALKINEAITFINENYASDLNMAVVSNHISMNYSLFSTEFKNVTGTNFITYVKDLRMGEAKRLLSDTDLKVNEISAKVGYDNEKHFMKSFKAYVGVSPSEFRKNALRG
ncbi:Two-component response regulator, YesN/AraC family, consists of REC and AraC-type DNA-binding domains [Pseudobutyrivibrio sp. OR37]|uniref:response regulator n=1 Tax=Pseudobutyrivibrio sp. OR37 TaxID=1798186 RepID=UPI0008E14C11|nr:response regulator [Pseudobutyrivibrio sp. OR37]SFH69254.1 Two-component response regulator, YesN/AraC family, consists of REC and AraC-type DNA-binding domains [Pseudobutyrivibrio sp. OR37]